MSKNHSKTQETREREIRKQFNSPAAAKYANSRLTHFILFIYSILVFFRLIFTKSNIYDAMYRLLRVSTQEIRAKTRVQ